MNEIIRQYMFRTAVMRNGTWVRGGELIRESEVKHENLTKIMASSPITSWEIDGETDLENEFMVTKEEGWGKG